MIFTRQTKTVPIRQDEDGVIRVGGTRVTLGTIVRAFNYGLSPEEIFIALRAVSLADIYEVIAFYLRHQSEVDAYIRDEHAEVMRPEFEARHPDLAAIRARLVTRLQAQRRRQD
jgi:uncharacterized protein (DUF433 family)